MTLSRGLSEPVISSKLLYPLSVSSSEADLKEANAITLATASLTLSL